MVNGCTHAERLDASQHYQGSQRVFHPLVAAAATTNVTRAVLMLPLLLLLYCCLCSYLLLQVYY